MWVGSEDVGTPDGIEGILGITVGILLHLRARRDQAVAQQGVPRHEMAAALAYRRSVKGALSALTKHARDTQPADLEGVLASVPAGDLTALQVVRSVALAIDDVYGSSFHELCLVS